VAFKPVTTEQQLHAIRALMRFEATAIQQRIAIEWLLRDVCGNDVTPAVYNEGLLSTNDTLLALGRHQVSTALWKTLAPAALDEALAHDAEILRRSTGLTQPTRTTRTNRRGKP